MITNIMSIVKPMLKTFRSGAALGLLVTASLVQGQQTNALADPVAPITAGKEELKMPPPLPPKEASSDDGLTKPAALPTGLGTPEQNRSIFDPLIQKASGCCGQTNYGHGNYSGCSGAGCSSGLCNGRPPCCYTDSDSLCGRIIGGLCEEICCVDPCYEPRWIPMGNAAFFQDGVRPVTTTRIRWDHAANYNFPDSSEFLWGQIGTKGPKNPTNNLRYDDLSIYQEIATKGGGASTFIEMPYRTIQSDTNPSAAGFIDMNLGFKSVLLDRELLLISTQFRTYIPIGNVTTGLGTGHVSLEPSLMARLKLTSATYLQTQFADWIPVGGTSGFMGSVIHYHVSLNHDLCNFACVKVISTMEFNGYSFRGQFTDVTGLIQDMAGSNFYSAGPGVRFQICNNADIGLGTAFGFGNRHGPDQLYRTEIRLRY